MAGLPGNAETPADPVDAAPDEPLTAARSSRARAGWRAVTTRGRMTALVAVIALAVGLAAGWREWLGVAAALGFLLLAAVVDVGRPFVLRGGPRPAAEPVRRRRAGRRRSMLVRNTSHRRMLPLRMELEVAGLAVSVPVPSLHGGAGHIVEVPLPTRRRAVIDLGPLRAVRGDVFGLIRRVVQWPVHRQVFVHPRTVRPSSSLPGYVHDLEGEESTKRTASDLSFHTLREYVPGDDRRFIHWKSTARNGTLQVREFLQTHRSQVGVVLSGSSFDYHWPGGRDVVRDSDLESGDDGGPEPTAEGAAERDRRGRRPTPAAGRRGRVRDRRRLRGVDGRRTGPAAARCGDRRRRPRDPRGDGGRRSRPVLSGRTPPSMPPT